MNRVSRRDFLGQALLAGAGSTFFHSFPLAVTKDDLSDYDPGFIAGRILTLSDGVLTVLDPDDQVRKARLGPSTLTWKRGLLNAVPLQPGDCAYTRGTPQADGVIDVESIWVDIHSVAGTYLTHDPTSLILVSLDGVQSKLQITPDTTFKGVDGSVRPLQQTDLSPGQLLQVIAFGDSQLGGVLTATSVFGFAYDAASGDGEEVSVSSTTFLRLSTWFCCGMVSGCGSGSCNMGGGACSGTCRTDRQHMAWPRLSTTNCNSCNGLACCTSLPAKPCNTDVTVLNPCTNMSRTIRLKDCGPSASTHSSVGCKNRSCKMFDLTACSFTAIGGSLSAGLINVNVTV